jgi:hypothetical protein
MPQTTDYAVWIEIMQFWQIRQILFRQLASNLEYLQQISKMYPRL